MKKPHTASGHQRLDIHRVGAKPSRPSDHERLRPGGAGLPSEESCTQHGDLQGEPTRQV
jgi:hypothetical protein